MNQCSFCQKPLGVGYYVTEVQDGAMIAELTLCDTCGSAYTEHCLASCKPETAVVPAESHVSVNVIKTAAQLLALILSKAVATSVPPPQPSIQHHIEPCVACGQTLNQIRESGRVGCPVCYDHFAAILDPIVRAAQNKSNEHVGKHPSKQPATPPESLETLRLNLSHAVEHEHYERAADLRDRIRALGSRGPNPESA